MKSWVVVYLASFLCGTRGENDSDCTPGARLAHPHVCSKYYGCDADNERRTFECPSDHLFNPVTTICEPAEKVTCFGSTEKDEEATVVEVGGGEYRGNVKDMKVKTTKQEDEPEQHKGFYFLEDSSDESSESAESERDESSNQDEIVVNGRGFSSDQEHSEEGVYTHDKSESSKRKEDVGEKDKDNNDSNPLEPSENPLNQESHKTKDVDKSISNISIEFHNPTEPKTIEEDYQTKEVEDQEPHAVEATADGYKDLKERLKKRAVSVKGVMPKSNETQTEGKTEDGLDEVEDEKIGIVSHGEELKVTGPLTTFSNDSTYQITKLDDTNVLRFGSFAEPIANWTESLYNGWTDLLIFWKHPVHENSKGSVFFKYPSDSMSDELEIKDLVLEILQLTDKTEESATDKEMALVHPKVDVPQETNVKGTQTA